MFEYKANTFESFGDKTVEDDNDVVRTPLVMIPKNNDYDP